MEVYEKAEELAKALMNTPEFKQYNALVDKACRDKNNRRIINEYIDLTQRYQDSETERTGSFSDEEMQHFEEVMDKAEAIPDFAQAIRLRCDYEDIFEKALNIVLEVTEKSDYYAGPKNA